MQSGITASNELHDAFNDFTSNPSLFALPITISNESLDPLPAIPFTSGDFKSSLPSLEKHLQPKTPIYLILRPDPASLTNLIAVTYVPSTAPVRSKMLFASTRSTLTRDLGLEKFGDSLFATDDFEVLDPAAWTSRGKRADGTQPGSEDILSTEERELQNVRRAEDEERHGTQGRDLMGKGGSGNRLAMKITEDAKQALATMNQEAALVQLGIEIASETLELQRSSAGITPDEFLGSIPTDRPSYTFYAHPGTSEVVFLYTCPGGSKVKERMLYASARSSVLHVAQEQGVNVTKRLEQGDVGEISEQRLSEEVGIGGAKEETVATSRGFARPKRPGKR